MRNAAVLLALFFVGCSTSEFGGALLKYPGRTLADWNPDLATAEAQHDIADRSPKIYLSGTIAAFAPGVDPDDYALFRSLPKADAGIGCLVRDANLRDTQLQYASRYNSTIVAYLKSKASKSPLPTRTSVTPRAGARGAPAALVARL